MMRDLPETEGPMRGWLRQAPRTSALVAERVYFGVPEQDRPELPFVVFYRVGGLPDDMSHDHPDFIIECWGANKHDASTLATAVASDVVESNQKPPTVIGNALVIAGRVNLGPVPSSSVSWAKRYRVDVSFDMRST